MELTNNCIHIRNISFVFFDVYISFKKRIFIFYYDVVISTVYSENTIVFESFQFIIHGLFKFLV